MKNMEKFLNFLPMIILIAVILALFIGLALMMYRKSPPSRAMIVTGPGGTKTIIGRGCFVIPIIQRVDFLSLENMQSDFTSKDEIPTKDAINILVDAVANFSISTDPELLKIAASKFLGYNKKDIEAIVRPVLEGNIREIISQTTLKELIQGDKKEFAQKVIDNVTPNFKDMGLELTTFNIQNFKDKNKVIENLGIENTVQISKDASISKANASKEIAIAEANAQMAANEAKVKADTEIAIKQNELNIKRSELKKQADIKAAEAAAAGGIQSEEQRKTLEITTAEANLAKQEKEIELKEREVTIKEKMLEAEVKKTAEAEKYAEQQRADASLYSKQKASEAELFERAKKAEAQQIEAERQAEAKKAMAEAIKAEGLAQADAQRAKGEAEAAAIKAKAEAEADGLMKKAEAMKQYGESAQMNMQLEALQVFFKQLPAIAEATGKAYTNVDKIVMLGGDSSKLTGDIMNNVTQVSEGLSESLGIDLKSLLTGLIGGKLISNNNTTEGGVTINNQPKVQQQPQK